MSNATFSIVMPRELRSFVERRVKDRSFGNLSEYFRHLVREDKARASHELLEQALLEGELSGPAVIADDAWWARRKRELKESLATKGTRKASVKRARRP